jgi:hypothetical protein
MSTWQHKRMAAGNGKAITDGNAEPILDDGLVIRQIAELAV